MQTIKHFLLDKFRLMGLMLKVRKCAFLVTSIQSKFINFHKNTHARHHILYNVYNQYVKNMQMNLFKSKSAKKKKLEK